MSSYKKYENDFHKYAGHSNQFKAPKSMIKEKDRTEKWQDNIIDWTTYYRRNIHRFVQHYFGVQLYWYQILWIYFMSISESFVSIASRASAKSWLIALFALAKAVLYPNSEIVIVAATQKQAGIIFGKIDMLRRDHVNIAREIKDFSNTTNNRVCILHNSSKLKVVAANESGRGERATCTIGEEFRIMDKQKYDSIVKPFAYARQAPYLKNPKYSHLIEEPTEILISSAYHKALWWYEETITKIKMMLNGEQVGFIAFDYLLAIKHGIKTKKQILREKTTMDEITFMEEYENIPYGESGNAFYKFDMFKKNRTIKKAFYPLLNDIENTKKKGKSMKRVDGEIRIVSIDIATRKNEENDNTIISCIRGIPTARGYKRETVYMESHHGEHTKIQALRIKQIFYDFEADYIVLDLQQAGITVFERLGEVTKDEERGVEYDAFTVFKHKSLDKKLIDELEEKTLSTMAKPVIFPISATAKLNNDIALDFRDKLKTNMCSFLIGSSEADDYLERHNKEFSDEDIQTKRYLINPYIETDLLINESINLEQSIQNGYIKLSTSGTARKDRYTSVSYGNYFISLLEKDYLKNDNYDDGDPLVYW